MKAIETITERGKIYIQIAEEPEIISTKSNEGMAAAVDIRKKLDEISETTTAVCHALFDKALMAMGEKKPNEFQIEFGVTLAGKAGIPLVTEGSAECALKVTAKWSD